MVKTLQHVLGYEGNKMHYIKLQPVVRKGGSIKEKPIQIYAIHNVKEEEVIKMLSG